MAFVFPPKATPIATTLSQHLPHSFFCRPAKQVAPELIGCLLVKCQADGELLWGVIVEAEALLKCPVPHAAYRRVIPFTSRLDETAVSF